MDNEIERQQVNFYFELYLIWAADFERH